MARSATAMKMKSYTRYSDAYRQEALALSERIAIAALVNWGYTRVSYISGALRPSCSKTHLNGSGRWQRKCSLEASVS